MRRPFLAAALLFDASAVNAAPGPRATAILTSGPEGDAGTRVLTITLNQTPQNLPITYTYRSIDGTATAADGDFTPLNGSVVCQSPSSQMTGGLRHSSMVVQMENDGAKS